MLKNSFRAVAGFTLIELLLVVSIIAVMSGLLIPGFSNYIENQNLRQAQELFKSDLRTAQNKALTGVDSAGGITKFWGIKITDANASNYYFFNSALADASTCDNVNIASAQRSEVLQGGAVVRDSAGSCIFFSLRNGDATVVNNPSGNAFGVAYPDDVACFGVEINSVGMIRNTDLCN